MCSKKNDNNPNTGSENSVQKPNLDSVATVAPIVQTRNFEIDSSSEKRGK